MSAASASRERRARESARLVLQKNDAALHSLQEGRPWLAARFAREACQAALDEAAPAARARLEAFLAAPQPADGAIDAADVHRIEDVLGALAPLVDPYTHTRARTILAWAAAALALAMLSLGVLAIIEALPPIHDGVASSSSVIGGDVGRHGARLVLDGDPGTEWQGENLTPCWLALPTLRSRVSRIVVRNGRNAPFLDRGVRDYGLTLLRSGAEVWSTRGALPDPRRGPAEVAIDVPGIEADEARLEVETYWGFGAAVADIRIE